MISSSPRAEAEAALGRALSRSIGFTSGAYELNRIVSVLDHFLERPSAYREEIVSHLRSRNSESDTSSELTHDYLSEIANFTQAMGLIETVSAREARLQRYAPTETGRALLGAKSTGDEDFYKYFLVKIVLIADADFILPVLSFFAERESGSLQEQFVNFQVNLRSKRWNWLTSIFKERILLERIAAHITWLGRAKGRGGEFTIEVPSANTARHHATPRQGWLHDLGLIDRPSRQITQFGSSVLRTFANNSIYFWLGPHSRSQGELRIPAALQLPGPFEDDFNFGDDFSEPSTEETSALIVSISEIMVLGFKDAKLVHARQASLRLPIEYISFRSYRDRRSYQWQGILNTLFSVYRGQLERLSAHKGQIGFYKVIV